MKPRSGNPDPPARPTITVGPSVTLPALTLCWLVGGLGLVLYRVLHGGATVYWMVAAALLAGGIGFALRSVLDRPARIVVSDQGVEIASRRTGLLKWREIVHIEKFPHGGSGAVALFLTEEAASRLPPQNDRDGLVYADPALGAAQYHVWFSDAGLDCTAEQIAAELEARRNGSTGPLTQRLARKRRARFLRR
jgi:hypothetical protein